MGIASPTIHSASIDDHGHAYTTRLVTFVSPGPAYFSIIGLPDSPLWYARTRIKTAAEAQGYTWPNQRVTANITPSSTAKTGHGLDLPIAATALCAAGQLDPIQFDGVAMIGAFASEDDEHSEGRIEAVERLPEILALLADQGVHTAIIPEANRDIEPIDGMHIIHVGTLADLRSIGHETRPLIDRIDRLVEDAHGIDDADDADSLITEIEAALDDLNAAIDDADRDPNAYESAAIAEAERAIDELEDYEQEE